MKLKRYKNNPILTPGKDKWEAGSVFNCGVVYDKLFHMVYRAVCSGFYPIKKEKWARRYGNYISSIGYAMSRDGINFERKHQLIKPEYKYEKYGCEDTRITKFKDTYYIFYTALPKEASYIENTVRVALATTKDFKKVKKHGVIVPNVKSKAGALFPNKINGKLAMLFAYMPDTPKSSIVYTEFDNIKQLKQKQYWEKFENNLKNNIVFSPPKGYVRGQEVGAPPLKTKKGWLLIYCGASKKRIWCISAALLDLKNPRKVISSSIQILKPEKKYELKGLVPNVTFPSGAVIVRDKLFVYYGGADSCCCLASCDLKELLDFLYK